MTIAHNLPQTFDHIIIGGGAAGCVLANRLTAMGDRRVLLIEAGVDTAPGAVPEDILDGRNPRRPLNAGDRYIWPDFNVALAAPRDGGPSYRRLYEQGRVLGGGSSVNMTAANRGLPRDYDEWHNLGATGWNWDGVLPYFRALEDDLDFAGDLHGKGGPITINRGRANSWPAFVTGVEQTLRHKGYADIGDQNGRFEDGYFRTASNSRNGNRVSTAIGYLDDSVRARPNLFLLTETRVRRVLFEGRRAVAVEIRHGDETAILKGAEIILAAGALQSPAFLLRAGIGPADELAPLGIDILADRPAVGRNLLDHAAVGSIAALPDAHLTLPDGSAPQGFGLRYSSAVDPAVPSDLYIVAGARAALGVGFLGVWVNKPSSSGSLRLESADPDRYANVDFRLLSDSRDLERLTRAFHLFHDLASANGFDLNVSNHGMEPQDKGVPLFALLETETALEDHLRASVKGLWHACGTCRMGAADDRDAVTDSTGRVIGVEGLRVADASVMPSIPAANIMLPTIMVAEKISAAILSQPKGSHHV